MSLSQFDGFSSQLDGQFILNVISPMVGTGSLRLNLPTGGTGNIAPDSAGPLTHGLTLARYETLARAQVSGIATSAGKFGIIFMQSAHNVTTGTPDFYFFGIENTGVNFSLGNYVLYKTTTGWSGISLVTSTVAISGPVFGIVQSFRVDFITDVPNLGGVWIKCYAGTVDFSSMTNIFNVIDFTSPLTTTVNEGLAVDAASTGSTLECQFDQTSLYEIT